MESPLNQIFQNSKFKETAIGLLLSYGGFSTLLPKFIESFNSINGTTTFGALTWFALFYFLLPCFIFLTFWNFTGYRQLINEKVKNDDNEIKYKPADFSLEWAFFTLKAIPFFLFSINKFIFLWGSFQYSSLIIIIWYLVIAILEFHYSSEKVYKYLKPIEESQTKNFLSILKYGVLISPLNLVLGIGLLYFSEPWFIYNNNMILILWSVLLFHFIAVTLIFALKVKILGYKTISLKFLFVPLLFLFSLIYLLPHVNRKITLWGFAGFHSSQPILRDFIVFIILFILIFISGFVIITYYFKNQRNFLRRKGKINSYVFEILILIGFFSLPFFFSNVVEHENSEYFKKRIKASEEITDKKLVPLFKTVCEKDIQLLEFVHKNNHFLRLHGNWEEVQGTNIQFESLIDKCNYRIINFLFKQEDQNKDSETFKTAITANFNSLNRMRSFFYGKYDSKLIDEEGLVNQDTINGFYSKLFIYLKDTVFPETIIPLSRNDTIADIVTHYLHPLNYYSYVVDHYEEQLDLTSNVLTDLKYLNYLSSIQENQVGNPIYMDASISSKKNELIKKINDIFPKIIEIQGTDYKIDDNFLKIDSTEKFFNDFSSFKQNQLTDRIKSAQIIYQSYLYDYQRIGFFLFLFQLIIFGFIYYESQKEKKQKQNGSKDSLDPIFIGLVTVLALMLPLMREIKAENIDPTKKYWMLNLSNWYSPGIIFPEQQILERNEKQIQINNNIKLESSLSGFLERSYNKTEAELRILRQDLNSNTDSLKNLINNFKASQSEFLKVKETTESIDKIIKK